MSQANPDWGQRPTSKKAAEGSARTEIDKLVNGGKGSQTARLNVEMDADLRAQFKARCAMEKLDMKDVVGNLVAGWMKQRS